MSEMFVLVPGRHSGAAVCEVGDLAARLADEGPEEAVDNAAIDSVFTDAEVPALAERVRALNATGDATAYWASAP